MNRPSYIASCVLSNLFVELLPSVNWEERGQ